jgi:hypothetical protein
MPSTIEDTNGNVVSISQPCGASTFSVSDTAGRVALSFQTSGSPYNIKANSVTVSGIPNPYSVTGAGSWPSGQAVDLHPALIAGTAAQSVSIPQWNTFSGSLGPPPTTEITALTLPNGEQYQFVTYGTVNKVTYANGGYVSYTWGLNAQSAAAQFTNKIGGANQCA